jgi:cysteine desulfurase / selenocysteine lyase
MNINSFRNELPHIAEGYVHLNHAGVSSVSTRVVSSISEFLDGQSKGSPAATMAGFGMWAKCRTDLAAIMGVSPENLALTKNTAHGVSIVADGFKWRDGDEVVFAECEYPANSYPWLAQQERRVVCRTVPVNADGTVPIESYKNAMTSKTKMVAVSWVQFSTGFRNDLAALTELAHNHGARILVDVIQGLGALPINLDELGVDYAATGSQKWLIGPLGVGGLYVKPDALNDLRMVNVGAASVINPWVFDALGFDPKPNAQRFEEGTPNIMGMIGLVSSLSMLADAGPAVVAECIKNVTDYAMKRLESAGYAVVNPKEWTQRAGIVLFKHPTIPNAEIMAALEQAKIVVVSRGGCVRFAPHFYNTQEDIDRAIAALPTA